MICNQALGSGPRTVLIEDSRGLSEAISVGEIVSISGKGVATRAGQLVSWSDSPQWVAEPPLGFGAGVGGRAARAEEIVGALGRFTARPLISRHVRELRAACQGLSLRGLEPAVAGLVGLGPGLTPAGDDYLGGYLAALLHISGTSRRAASGSQAGRQGHGQFGGAHPSAVGIPTRGVPGRNDPGIPERLACGPCCIHRPGSAWPAAYGGC